MRIPLYSEDLIKQLDSQYPLYNPKDTDTIEKIQRKAGQRDVVERLIALLKTDQEKE